MFKTGTDCFCKSLKCSKRGPETTLEVLPAQSRHQKRWHTSCCCCPVLHHNSSGSSLVKAEVRHSSSQIILRQLYLVRLALLRGAEFPLFYGGVLDPKRDPDWPKLNRFLYCMSPLHLKMLIRMLDIQEEDISYTPSLTRIWQWKSVNTYFKTANHHLGNPDQSLSVPAFTHHWTVSWGTFSTDGFVWGLPRFRALIMNLLFLSKTSLTIWHPLLQKNTTYTKNLCHVISKCTKPH